MRALLVLLSALSGSDGKDEGSDEGPDAGGDEGPDDDAVQAARRRLRRAMEAARSEAASADPAPAAPAASPTPPVRPVGQKVDRYFGTRLPPVCDRLGCYLTDDGKRFYCVNPGCQKHKKRATKHSRVRRAKKQDEVFFRCPKCLGRNVEVLRLTNEHACNDCDHRWPIRRDEAEALQAARDALAEPEEPAPRRRPTS